MSYNYIECPICGCKLKMLTKHMSSYHGLSRDEVKLRYPGIKLTSDSYHQNKSREMTERNKRNWKDPEYIKVMTEHWNQKLADPEFQDKKEKARVEALNRDSYLIPMRERVKKQYHELNMGELFLAGRMTPENRRKRSKLSSKILKNRWKDPEFRAKMSRSKNFGKITEYTLSSNDTVRLRSNLEYETYEYLLNYFNFSEIKYEDILIPYIDSEGASRTYHTDFYIPRYNFIIEVKPEDLWCDKLVQLKKDATIERGFNFTFSGYSEIEDNSLYNIIIGKASKKL